MDNLTILIADDHPVFRKGLRALLSTMSNVELVGEAASGEEAITLAEKLQPDVVLLDLQMPGGGGLNAIRSIVHTSPHIRILVVTMFEDDDSIFEAMRAGARGYVLKDTQDEELERAILAVGNGEAIFSPAIALRMINFFATRPPAMPDLFPELTAIGRFGIGFKSVYALTDSPEVYSGSEHFAIDSFVWPRQPVFRHCR